jgi:DNA-3-methyladenine glycosylase II
MSLHTVTGHLSPVPPFDFAQSLTFLGGFGPALGTQTVTEQALTKAVAVAGQPVVARVTAGGTVEAPRLTYTLFAAQPITAAIQAAVVDRLRFYLSLDDDLTPFYAIGQADPVFAPIIQQLYGYHQVKFLTPFENAVWAILSQRNYYPVTRKQKEALTEHYGQRLNVEGTDYWAFPEPGDLARANPDEMLAVVRNERKAPQVQAVAQAFNGVAETWLRTAPYAEVRAWLRQIPGIGDWSADFIMVRGLGRMDRVPSGEKRLLAAASRLYGQGRTLKEDDLPRIAASYGPWQGYWAHYLRAAS